MSRVAVPLDKDDACFTVGNGVEHGRIGSPRGHGTALLTQTGWCGLSRYLDRGQRW
jgi:hypothetical protein